MARAFSDREKDAIRAALLEKGREMFGAYGLKRTGVAELARAVGIAPGSFYSFFGSKEELLFAVMEEEEKRIHAHFAALLSCDLTRSKLKRLLVEGVALAEENSVLRQLMDPEVYQRVLRKLPEEKVRQHIQRDRDLLSPLISHWQDLGEMEDRSPDVVSGLLRALFVLTLHKKEIGEEIFDDVVDLLADLVASGLVREEGHND